MQIYHKNLTTFQIKSRYQIHNAFFGNIILLLLVKLIYPDIYSSQFPSE